jgi:monovalent cation:H+ antiporter-2, CPA2 family
LFTIGLELSLTKLKSIFRKGALGGALQVGLTIAAGTALAHWAGFPTHHAVLVGFVLSLSSSAIVLKELGERHELEAPYGRFVVGTLIFQDLCVVPMVLLIPLIAQPGDAQAAMLSVSIALAKAAAVVAVVLFIARFAVPRVLRWVDASRSREVFLLSVVAICVGTAWLTSLVQLSVALGAFLAGIVVADTEFRHRALGDLLPLRDVFVSVFFVSLGMLFDVRVLVAAPFTVAGLSLALIAGKALLAALAALLLRLSARGAWLAGVGLAQFGEFGFVLLRLAESHGIASTSLAPMLNAGIISMCLTPLLIRAAPRSLWGERLVALGSRLLPIQSHDDRRSSIPLQEGHIVLIGFGLAGQLVAEVLERLKQEYIGLEMNAETVRQARALGKPLHYADATQDEALLAAHVQTASCAVVLINDPSAAHRVIDSIRRLTPDVPVVSRVRYLAEKQELLGAGAQEVVAEDLAGSMQLIEQVLRQLQVSNDTIDESLAAARESQVLEKFSKRL